MVDSPDTRIHALCAGLDRIAFFCLYALVFVIPWEEVVPLVGGISVIRWSGLLAFGTACFRTLAYGRARKPSLLHYIMMALIFWSSLSILWSVVPESTASLTGTYLQLIILVWLVWELASTEERVAALLQAYVLGSIVSSAETVRNAIAGRTAGDVYAQEYGIVAASGSRYSAGGFNLNDLGLLLTLSIPMSIYLLSRGKNGKFQSVYWVHLALAATAVILTASRGSAIALAVSFMIVPLTITYWSKWQRYASIAILAAGVGFAAYTIPGAVWNRLLQIGDEFQRGTLSQRTTIWSASTEVFRNHPFAGVGAGGFAEAVTATLGIPQVAHNTFVSVFVELGMIGGLTLAALLLALFYCSSRLPPLGKRLWTVTLLAWMVGVCGLTWEYRKPTWCVFALVAAHAGAKPAKYPRLRPRSRGFAALL